MRNSLAKRLGAAASVLLVAFLAKPALSANTGSAPYESIRDPSPAVLVPWVSANGYYGYADLTGAVRIPPRFIEARAFYEGLAAVAEPDRGWGYVRPNGEFQIPPKFDEVGDFLDGKAIVALRKASAFPALGAWVGASPTSSSTTHITIGPTGAALARGQRGGIVSVFPAGEKPVGQFFSRYPEPAVPEADDWREIMTPGGVGTALKRQSDGKLIIWAKWMRVIRDATSGKAVLFAGHDDLKPWTIWDLSGRPIISAASLQDVFSYANEGIFCAAGGAQGWWAAFDLKGKRLTPYFGESPFIFDRGIARVWASQNAIAFEDRRGKTVLGSIIYIDSTGRQYADAEFLKRFESALRSRPPSNPYWNAAHPD